MLQRFVLNFFTFTFDLDAVWSTDMYKVRSKSVPGLSYQGYPQDGHTKARPSYPPMCPTRPRHWLPNPKNPSSPGHATPCIWLLPLHPSTSNLVLPYPSGPSGCVASELRLLLQAANERLASIPDFLTHTHAARTSGCQATCCCCSHGCRYRSSPLNRCVVGLRCELALAIFPHH